MAPNTVGQLMKREVSGWHSSTQMCWALRMVEASLACGALGIARLQKKLLMVRSQSPQTLWP